MLTAGEYKRTLTVFGENTEKGREKFQEDLETIHEQFKGYVARYRPQLSIEEVATGEVWLGQVALGKQLVDEIRTSDEYLAARAREADVYQLSFVRKKSVQERFGIGASAVIDRVLVTWWERLARNRFWQ
ncbi:putative protease SohB [compost metagenome]